MALQEPDLGEYRAGDRVAGQLRVEALLGEGGAGAVYRVRDERKGRRLALKQLRAPDNEHKALLTSQFEREFHTLSELAHPRIIEVYDYGVDRECPYYTMELLDGEDLHDRGKLPFQEACALLRDVASSLAILHSRGRIHRDVSARNVRCTSDGRAKLIDFGAMVPVGGGHRPVGTPPFVPPEVLQMQALDARADLYGLGALAYWTLTGRHAHPAHTFNQLRDSWRRTPRKPSELDPEIPEPLGELVMSLLRLDRDERPRTASEVMARLSGIAGLPVQELPQVGRAYLITPRLIGRDDSLASARALLFRSLQCGRGGTLLIEGVAGVGRSRLLDACVLEAKLMGATVLRAAAADASTGDYGAARALLSQLAEACPDLVEQTAHPRASLLVHVLPSLVPHAAAASKPERRHIQAALRDFFLSIARETHIVIAVDDVGMLDEPSSALLGVLAHGAGRRRLTLLVTAKTEMQTPALAVLRENAERTELSALDALQTETLLRALFGDSVQASTLAARLFPLSQGRPRELMALAEHLVERGLARSEAGSWSKAAIEAGLIAASPSTDASVENVEARDDDARTVYSRMLTCISADERAERALQLLLEATGARMGYFFGLRSGKLTLLFSPDQAAVPGALTSLLEDCLDSELRSVPPASRQSGGSSRPQSFVAPLARFVDDFGREFEPLVLAGTHHGEPMIAGVAALHYAQDDRAPPRKGMLDAVFEALISDDVVDPITCVTWPA